MTISVRLNPEETELFKSYAKMHGLSLSDLIRDAVLEKIEDEHDLKCYTAAMDEYRQNPETNSHEDVVKMLGIDE